jgi:putative tryptophan/tyrosine transport system substrate-binding protein
MPHAVRAQQGNRIPVIGFLHSGSAGTVQRPSSTLQALRAGLASQGYVEGKTLRIEARFAEGKPEQSPALALELLRLKVDLIVAVGPSSVKAALAASRDLPIVALDLETDPVASGLIATLAKPGGNLTGLFLDHADLAAKWLQLITEAVCAAHGRAA